MKSMTGYGRGECAQHGHKVTVELTSVNRRQGEISLNLPREIEGLESRIRDRINQSISRGRLTARLALHLGEADWKGRIRLNVPLARTYVREFRRLARELKLAGEVTLEAVLRAPGVLQTEEDADAGERFWPEVEKALDKALAALVRMREREGGHLAKDLKQRMAAIRKTVRRVAAIAPEIPRRYQEQLRERIRQAGLPLPAAEDERLLREVVYFTDRSDISEELTRLQSHFAQFDECLQSTEPVGRTLDFLVQELNREVNTIGSKANDGRISREVVRLKAELEKLREQVQNIE